VGTKALKVPFRHLVVRATVLASSSRLFVVGGVSLFLFTPPHIYFAQLFFFLCWHTHVLIFMGFSP